MEQMNVLVTLDSHYIPQLRVMLSSMRINNPGEGFSIYLIHSSIPDDETWKINAWCSRHGWDFHAIQVGSARFRDAPVSDHYPKEMYYRLPLPISFRSGSGGSSISIPIYSS